MIKTHKILLFWKNAEPVYLPATLFNNTAVNEPKISTGI
jgi:hypothetical protein